MCFIKGKLQEEIIKILKGEIKVGPPFRMQFENDYSETNEKPDIIDSGRMDESTACVEQGDKSDEPSDPLQ